MKLTVLYVLITAMFLCFESCRNTGLLVPCVFETHSPADVPKSGDIRGAPLETDSVEETIYAGNDLASAPACDYTKPDIQGERAPCETSGAFVSTTGGMYCSFLNRFGEDGALFGVLSPELLFFLFITGIGFLARALERINDRNRNMEK
ncbi:MAG: hypothetical protein LBR26_12405 [Prevotella sp.]|jgi:hypothetical protein|nr:hypothetical protein [Prevotella sp.]